MGQMFYIPKSELNLDGQTLRVDFFEWAGLTLDYDQFAQFELDMTEHEEFVAGLVAEGKFIDGSMEELSNGDVCATFIFPNAPGEIIPTHPLRQKWEDIFAADPNVTYSGQTYIYLRDV